jgi:hypothetical protein
VSRWKEELILVEHEMLWTIKFYNKRKQEWENRAKQSEERGEWGHACYAHEQKSIWDQFGTDAQSSFRMVVDIV